MLEQANLGYRRFLAVASVALFVAIGYLAVNHSHAATGYVHVSGGAIYDGYGNKILLTGVDGGSWMTRGEGTTPSACGKTWSGDPAQAASIAAMGMNTERIAITWANVEPTAPTVNPDGSLTHHWDAAYLTALDGLIQADRAAGVMAIIDMHQASGWSPAFTAQDNCGGNGQPSWLYPNLPDTKAGINSAQCEFFTNKKMIPASPNCHKTAWRLPGKC